MEKRIFNIEEGNYDTTEDKCYIDNIDSRVFGYSFDTGEEYFEATPEEEAIEWGKRQIEMIERDYETPYIIIRDNDKVVFSAVLYHKQFNNEIEYWVF